MKNEKQINILHTYQNTDLKKRKEQFNLLLAEAVSHYIEQCVNEQIVDLTINSNRARMDTE